MFWIKFLLLFIGLVYGTIILVRTCYEESIHWLFILITVAAFAGFAMLQWFN